MPKRLNNNRKFPDGTRPRPDYSEYKRKEAAERQEAYDKLSLEDKLAKIDALFGAGNGAKRQRARLARLVAERSAPKVAKVEVAAEVDSISEEPKQKPKAKERRAKEKRQ